MSSSAEADDPVIEFQNRIPKSNSMRRSCGEPECRGGYWCSAFAEHDSHGSYTMSASKQPVMRSFLAATPDFASGKTTPRQFLERSLELLGHWEPRIGAFVCTDLPWRAGGGGPLGRALGARQAKVARSTACRSASRTSSRRSICRPRWARRCLPAGAPRRTRHRCGRYATQAA